MGSTFPKRFHKSPDIHGARSQPTSLSCGLSPLQSLAAWRQPRRRPGGSALALGRAGSHGARIHSPAPTCPGPAPHTAAPSGRRSAEDSTAGLQGGRWRPTPRHLFLAQPISAEVVTSGNRQEKMHLFTQQPFCPKKEGTSLPCVAGEGTEKSQRETETRRTREGVA